MAPLDVTFNTAGMTVTDIQINPIDKLWYVLTDDFKVYKQNSSSQSGLTLFCSGTNIAKIEIDLAGMLFGLGEDKKIYNASDGAWIKWADNDDSDFKSISMKMKRKFGRIGYYFHELHQDGTGICVQ